MKEVKIPGGRYWEPTEDRSKEETENEWAEFEAYVEEYGFPVDKELPFN